MNDPTNPADPATSRRQTEDLCAESAAPASESFDRVRAYRSAEETWWRRDTDDGRDTAFGRRLAAEQRQAVAS